LYYIWSQFGGIHPRTVPTDLASATLPVEEVMSRVQTDDLHNTKTELLCLENSHCGLGGRVIREDYFKQVTTLCYNLWLT